MVKAVKDGIFGNPGRPLPIETPFHGTPCDEEFSRLLEDPPYVNLNELVAWLEEYADVELMDDIKNKIAATELCLFVRDNDKWRIAFRGPEFTIPHSKGMARLAEILRMPFKTIWALELEEALDGREIQKKMNMSKTVSDEEEDDEEKVEEEVEEEDSVGNTRDDSLVGQTSQAPLRSPMIDNKTVQDIKKALENINMRLRFSTDSGERAELEEQQERLKTYLQNATGLHGIRSENNETRNRRSRIQQSITRAIARIEGECPDLGTHLRAHILTGNSFIYNPPDPAPPWQF
jgi:hypothetical protein